ncbi:sigma-54 dependent transcriptional regulator [Candidatus Aminicenantes bacterium AC-335-K20]|jgi:DNA-binding NtrC family response regulator|nr:sigma-54 dependent transcriptional regulator [SCandidatus Aminicenantes bacterium Aminicenantia_JdfR_composite]MCP2596730.1 sigma-54 dependent transcriptional regulator [Candidatus Aminicenantes bacterium AC-335-G13]MCP2618520.1 sigma-54 dependent transcriptional regulator [Candidatus Aminicenantes bacterium AC-335-A11]MCP2619276.1 sigma-54 dependent transcriptional regulator [Candidatus Aminicenantes bacterium AC-335-K20]MCP2620422.1 sigma-54 dependent transcriptional regulator [Candidatus 
MKILIVEDKKSMREMLSLTLKNAGYEVDEAGTAEEAVEKLEKRRYLLLLSDLFLPGMDGLELLKIAKKIDPYLLVIMITAYGTIEKAVEAMREGAYDFLSKPVDPDYLVLLINRALEQERIFRENILLKEEFAKKYGFPQIVGEDPKIKEVSQKAQKVAQTNSTVLLLGESGTGKELFARAIHQLSPRRNYPFITFNCASVPETLIENELFGHEKGAYTGATSRKLGRLELANKGTFFLDEIGDLSFSLQAKLLRVLEEKAFERIGGTSTIEVDVRFILATNKDLKKEVEEGRFREDLYFRISVFPITLPPLRERKGDIPLLANYFLNKFSIEMRKRGLTISREAINKLMNYSWPGNVRELQNCIERAVILCDGKEILPEHIILPEDEIQYQEKFNLYLSGTLKEAVEKTRIMVEREKIRRTLEETSGDKKRTAELLGISYKTLLNKIKELKINY